MFENFIVRFTYAKRPLKAYKNLFSIWFRVFETPMTIFADLPEACK